MSLIDLEEKGWKNKWLYGLLNDMSDTGLNPAFSFFQ